MDNNTDKKETTERPVSPEQVDDYIRVTNPGMWILLMAMLVLVAAGIIWAYAAKLEVKVTTASGEVTTEYISPASFLDS